MKTIEPSYVILSELDGEKILKNIELIGRVCYKSENKVTDLSSRRFVANILKNGHESVIEHETISVKFICDRGVSHEIVRHRIASFSQESTRYCNYTNDKFGNELTFIRPYFWSNDDEKMRIWINCMETAEKSYNDLIKLGVKPQEARTILPNSLKTELIMTTNLREWRHFFKLRVSPQAHPQMRQVTCPLLEELKQRIPIVFDDIKLEK